MLMGRLLKSSVTILISTLLTLAFTACGGSGNGAIQTTLDPVSGIEAAQTTDGFVVQVQPQQPREFSFRGASVADTDRLLAGLPVPRAASYTADDLRKLGGSFETGLPSAHVAVADDDAVFSPTWDHADPGDGSGLAYCMYRFQLADYDELPTVSFTWLDDTPPVPTGGNINFWVGLANRETDTWDWYEGPAIDHVLTLASLAPYFDENNYIIVTVALLGTTEYTLTYVMLGNPEVRNCGDLGITGTEMAIPPLEAGGLVQPALDLSLACPPVRNQGRWFSCCAFAVGDGAFNFELGQLYHSLGWDFEDVYNLVSPMYLYIEAGNNLSFPPNWSLGRVTKYMGEDLVTQGIATEQNAPYNLIYADNWSDEALADAALLHSASWTGIDPTTPEGLATVKTVLVRLTRPVIVRLNIDGGFLNYVEGIWDLGDTSTAGHTMLITGFDDAQSTFTVRNSFGEEWGEDGYLRMSYDTLANPEARAWCWFLTAEYDDAVATRFTGASLDLAPPVGVQATQGTQADGVHLSWDAGDGATAYRIYRDRTTNLVAEPGAVTEWVDTTAAADTSYAYWVRQFDGTDWSGLSAPAIGWVGEDPGDVETGEWTSHGHDMHHTGQSPFVGPYAADLLWTYEASSDLSGTPVIDPDGVIYVGDWDGLVSAVNPDGSLKWSYQTGADYSGIRSALALAPDGTVYAPNWDGVLYAINPDGTLKWAWDSESPAVAASPTIGPDGTIYTKDFNGNLTALDPAGTVDWTYPVGDYGTSPAIGADGTIYAGGDAFYAINPDGTLKWTYPTIGAVNSATAIGPDGSIYFCVNTLREYLLIALNPDGTEQWIYDNSANGEIGAGPAVGANGTIYVGSWDNHVHALNPDGTVRWKYEAGGDISSSPAIGADGTVYVGAEDLYVHAVNHLDGTLRWKYRGDGFFDGGPALGPDGTVYIGNGDKNLYALGPGETVLSPPAGLQASDGTEEGLVRLTWDHQDRVIQPDGYNIFRAEVMTGPYTFLADAGYVTSYDDPTTDDGTTYWYRASGYRDGYEESVQGTTDCGYNQVLSGPGDWSMFGREITHNRRSPANGPATNNLLWSFTTGGGVKSSPAITSDGTVYVGSGDGNLYAVYPDGTQRWACDTGAEIYSSPAIAPDGTIYVGNQEFVYRLYAIKPDGTVKWFYGTLWHVDSSPAIGPDGRVYFGCWDYKLRALNADGTLAWEYDTGQIIGWSSPALAADGTVYIGSNVTNSLFAVNADGTLAWSYAMGAYVESSPAIGADGTVYVGSKDDKFYAINSDGSLAWSYTTGGDVDSSPAIGTDGTVYVGSGDGSLYALDGEGALVWSYPTGEGIYSSPAIDAAGVIYFGSNDDSVYALNPDGTLLWSYATGGDVGSAPALSADGRLYVGSYDGKLYAFGAE